MLLQLPGASPSACMAACRDVNMQPPKPLHGGLHVDACTQGGCSRILGGLADLAPAVTASSTCRVVRRIHQWVIVLFSVVLAFQLLQHADTQELGRTMDVHREFQSALQSHCCFQSGLCTPLLIKSAKYCQIALVWYWLPQPLSKTIPPLPTFLSLRSTYCIPEQFSVVNLLALLVLLLIRRRAARSLLVLPLYCPANSLQSAVRRNIPFLAQPYAP